MACKAYQAGDQMLCPSCSLQWDVNDPEPPNCNVTVDFKRSRLTEAYESILSDNQPAMLKGAMSEDEAREILGMPRSEPPREIKVMSTLPDFSPFTANLTDGIYSHGDGKLVVTSIEPTSAIKRSVLYTVFDSAGKPLNRYRVCTYIGGLSRGIYSQQYSERGWSVEATLNKERSR